MDGWMDGWYKLRRSFTVLIKNWQTVRQQRQQTAISSMGKTQDTPQILSPRYTKLLNSTVTERPKFTPK